MQIVDTTHKSKHVPVLTVSTAAGLYSLKYYVFHLPITRTLQTSTATSPKRIDAHSQELIRAAPNDKYSGLSRLAYPHHADAVTGVCMCMCACVCY